MTDRDHVVDPVAAAERTALSWERTGFGLVGIGALLAHASQQDTSRTQLGLGVLVLAAGAACSVIGAPARYRAVIVAVRAGHSPVSRRGPFLLALTVCLVALTAAVLLP